VPQAARGERWKEPRLSARTVRPRFRLTRDGRLDGGAVQLRVALRSVGVAHGKEAAGDTNAIVHGYKAQRVRG
jgi:hypothetical protein